MTIHANGDPLLSIIPSPIVTTTKMVVTLEKKLNVADLFPLFHMDLLKQSCT